MIFMALAFAVFGILFGLFGLMTEKLLFTGFGIVFVIASVFLIYQIAKEKDFASFTKKTPKNMKR